MGRHQRETCEGCPLRSQPGWDWSKCIPTCPVYILHWLDGWRDLQQYARKAIDVKEATEDKFVRIILPDEQEKLDSVDPCKDCICTKYMGPDYCDRPCRDYIRHYNWLRKQLIRRLGNGKASV